MLHVTAIETFRTHIPTSHHHISVIRRVEFSLPLQSLQMLETSRENAVCPPSNMSAHTPGQNHLLHVSYTSDADTTRTSLHPSQFTHYLVCFLMGSTVKDHNSFAWCGWATSNVHGRNCFAKAPVRGAQRRTTSDKVAYLPSAVVGIRGGRRQSSTSTLTVSLGKRPL